MATESKVVRLGDRLLQDGVISEGQLKLALREQKRVDEPLGRILVNLGFLTETVLAKKLADQMEFPFLSLKSVEIDPDLVRSIPPEMARQHLFIPVSRDEDGTVTVAMADPSDVISVDAIQEFLGSRIEVMAGLESEISSAITTMLEWDPEDEKDSSQGPNAKTRPAIQIDDLSLLESVDRIMDYALRNQATDIHIEPEKKLLRVRYRIDGMLHLGETLPWAFNSAVINRIKIMGAMDITERRMPQDGRISIDYNQRKIDLRVSTMPTNHGENLVIRILDRGSVSLDMKELGVHDAMRKGLIEMANQPYGMILVSGPTGSGKTTTLYSLLLSIDSMVKKTVTVEDPIEYELPLIRQSQVDNTIGYTFAEGLRTILRQDPDVILVGEIRDRETADVAMRASLTGHVVLSSIHTNTALGAMPRLIDIGLDPFLITSSLSGVIAQRLVRKICDDCKEPYDPSPEELEWLGDMNSDTLLYRARGCPRCRNTGYVKRTAIFEMVRMNRELASLIAKGGNEKQMEGLARESGMQLMVDDGKHKVRQGLTTIQEVLRVCQTFRS